MTGRHDLTGAQWTVLEPLLPAPSRPGRPSRWSKRQLIDGIRVGAPWRDIPPDYGSWSAVYALFRRWQRDATWAVLLTALQTVADAAGRIAWEVSVDSTTAWARQRGICGPSRLVGSAVNLLITRWGVLGVG